MLVCGLAVLSGFVQRDEFDIPAKSMDSANTFHAQAVEKIDPEIDPLGHSKQRRLEQITARFEQAVAMLHAKRYEYAVTALDRVLELSPNMPEAHANKGFAYLGLKNYKAAGDSFATAIRIKPFQANAYWGLAVSLEQLGDVEAALGAMRSYIHLAKPDDPYVRKARSALWEWEERMKRGPLPEEEAEWLERRGREWDERNSPSVDMPASEDREIDLLK
jgi:tetratricopeptide (TPR) repeat protein